ncbi:MAG TPA: carboxypeptidase-like regulatory domain-containing protein, partial [Terriglobia bacterium]|nr:carboxypeptidase-like regulatory domain-containing protein [Terriglobia bacterium]
MIALLLAAAMAVQGPGALMPGTGIVTGVLKTADGKPAADVRVGAVDIDDPSASSLLSVTQTDAQGRYRLINIPAGNYYIVAGRLNNLKYYPSGERTTATQILIEPARTRADVNFTVPAGAERPPTPAARFTPSGRVVSAPAEAEYLQLAAEKDLNRKAQLTDQYAKNHPQSLRIAEAYLSLMTAYAARSDVARMLEFGDKAVNSVSADINTHIQVSRSYAS